MSMDSSCAISRSLSVLGERWTFLILRDAFGGSTRFAQFRESLGVAPDVLTERLKTLVDYGVMARVPYQEPGSRARVGYELTASGRELLVVLGALQQWGDAHLPWPAGPSILRRTAADGRPLHVSFVDEDGDERATDEVAFVRTAAYPG